MRFIKMLGLAAVAAMTAMAFVGATSASATTTALCPTHGELTCSLPTDIVSMEGSGSLLSESVEIICDTVSATGTPLESANPQLIHVSELEFESCETSEADGCVVTVNELPLAYVNKTGLDTGTLTDESGETFVECEDVFFGLDLECTYDFTGLEFAVGAQHLTANDTPINEIGSDILCPNEPTLDGLLETTVERYVLQPGNTETALCKTHPAETCPKGDKDGKDGLVTDVHFLAKNPGWKFKNDEVKCEESLLKGKVGALALPQVITVEELTWKNCKLEGKNCATVKTEVLGTWEIGWEKLNYGGVIPKSWVKVKCGTTIDCEVKPADWKIEGAAGAHKGKIVVFANVVYGKKGGTCPKPAIWLAEYESVTDKVYVLK